MSRLTLVHQSQPQRRAFLVARGEERREDAVMRHHSVPTTQGDDLRSREWGRGGACVRGGGGWGGRQKEGCLGGRAWLGRGRPRRGGPGPNNWAVQPPSPLPHCGSVGRAAASEGGERGGGSATRLARSSLAVVVPLGDVPAPVADLLSPASSLTSPPTRHFSPLSPLPSPPTLSLDPLPRPSLPPLPPLPRHIISIADPQIPYKMGGGWLWTPAGPTDADAAAVAHRCGKHTTALRACLGSRPARGVRAMEADPAPPPPPQGVSGAACAGLEAQVVSCRAAALAPCRASAEAYELCARAAAAHGAGAADWGSLRDLCGRELDAARRCVKGRGFE